MSEIFNLYDDTKFPDWDLEEFDAIQEDHVFSMDYQKRKKKLIKACQNKRTFHKPFGMSTAAAVALVCVLGSVTVFAATGLYRFIINKSSSHSAEVGLEITASEKADAMAHNDGYPAVDVVFGYLPEDVIESDKGEYFYIGTSGDYGYYTSVLAVDTPADWKETFVTNAESLVIQGREALLVETQNTSDVEWAGRDLYISFPEESRIVYIWGWGQCTREELLQIAENISLKETGGAADESELAFWSDFAAYKNGDFNEPRTADDESIKMTATAGEMSRLHPIGEAFTMPDTESVEITVKDASAHDDLSSLTNTDQIPDTWLSLIGSDGNLKTDDLLYVKYGDGEESLDSVVRREAKELKLLLVTAEYKNTGAEDLTDVLFFGSTMQLAQDGSGWIISGADKTEADDVDHETAMVGTGEMFYYDITGGERNNNYIPELKAGQAQDVHMAWIVDADSLDQIYLNLSPSGWWDRFNEEDLAIGYVDLSL